MPSWISYNGQNMDWLLLLLTLTTFSFLGVAIPNLVAQLKNPRFHNVDKFINEWLARTHVAFLSYYFTLLIVVEIKSISVKRILVIMAVLSFFFFCSGLYYAAIQDDKLARLHQCPQDPQDPQKPCEISLQGSRKSIYGVTIGLFVLTAVVALLFTFSTVVVKP